MIYIFNSRGECIQVSNSVREIETELDQAIITRQLADLAHTGPLFVAVSAAEYPLETVYYDAGTVKQRPPNPAQLAGMVLSNLPVPCTVQINGTEYPWAEPALLLDLPLPATYTVTVKAWPYLDQTFSVEVP